MLLFLKDKKESSNLSVDIIWLTVIFKITVLQGSLREVSPKRRRLVVIFFQNITVLESTDLMLFRKVFKIIKSPQCMQKLNEFIYRIN